MRKLLRDYRWLCVTVCLMCLVASAWWVISHGSQASEWVVKAGSFAVIVSITGAVMCWNWGGELQLQAKAPNEPWLWRADWARGEVVFSTWMDVLVAWGLVAVVGTVGYGLAFLTGAIGKDESGNITTHWSFWAVTAFEAGFLIMAAWRTRTWVRLGGRSVLRLGTLPGRAGGRLTGTVNFANRQHSSEGYTAILTCFRTVVKGERTEQHLEQALLPLEGFPNAPQNAGRGRLDLPLTFQIPPDSLPTSGGVVPNDDAGDDEWFVAWILTVKARDERDDFEITFEVPVFA
ncbi:MAG: hypothetical protein B9S33_13245 [Pedosphaera sp. Tous-C6FEB]|nr:MAG: hypothetical protein B9S33_13245 [Pedosphaera sp. Tous-C6FEB]